MKNNQNNQYQWNDYGVCVNPTISKEWHRKHQSSIGYYVRIKVGRMQNGKWCCGYDYAHDTGGGSSPCSPGYRGREVYNTADEAERATIQHLYNHFKEDWTMKDCQDMIEKLKEWLQPKQLSLFEL